MSLIHEVGVVCSCNYFLKEQISLMLATVKLDYPALLSLNMPNIFYVNAQPIKQQNETILIWYLCCLKFDYCWCIKVTHLIIQILKLFQFNCNWVQTFILSFTFQFLFFTLFNFSLLCFFSLLFGLVNELNFFIASLIFLLFRPASRFDWRFGMCEFWFFKANILVECCVAQLVFVFVLLLQGDIEYDEKEICDTAQSIPDTKASAAGDYKHVCFATWLKKHRKRQTQQQHTIGRN